MLKQFQRTATVYAKLPEMRLFWILLPIVIVLISISFFYMPPLIGFISAGIFTMMLLVVFLNNLRLATSNLEVKVERNQLSGIVNNLQDGIIAYDTNFKILVFNRSAEIIFGVPANEILGRVYAPDTTKSSRSLILAQAMFPSLAPVAISRSEPNSPVTITDLSFEEPKLELRVSTVKIIDPAGGLLGFLKIINNRTREVEIARSKSEFITIAAHQLRTPMSGINWTFEMLEKEAGLSAPAKEFVINGGKAASAVLKIVNDLLDVSKIEEGKFGYEFQSIDIIKFLEDILGEAIFFAEKYGVHIYFEKPAESPLMLTIDPQKLSLVLNNLIDNAIKYNVKNGQVIVKLVRLTDSPYAKISITDTGLGIPHEDIDKLFKKFFRADNALKVETVGSGLGLYIARNVILRHGGNISVDSELNRGTTVTFTLPTDPGLVPKQEVRGLE